MLRLVCRGAGSPLETRDASRRRSTGHSLILVLRMLFFFFPSGGYAMLLRSRMHNACIIRTDSTMLHGLSMQQETRTEYLHNCVALQFIAFRPCALFPSARGVVLVAYPTRVPRLGNPISFRARTKPREGIAIIEMSMVSLDQDVTVGKRGRLD